MGRYDNIDIFFIALISAYFVTLFCIVLALIIIKIKSIVNKRRANKEIKESNETIIIKPTEEHKKKEKNKTKFRFTDSAIIKKLFMKKVSKEEKEQKENIIKKEKIRVLLTTRIKPEAKIEAKDFKTVKEPIAKTNKVTEKKETSNKKEKELKTTVSKTTAKKTNGQVKKNNTAKKKVANKTTNKSGTNKSNNTKPSGTTKSNSTKKRTTGSTSKTKNSNGAKKATSSVKQKTSTKSSNKKTVKK